MGIFMNFDKYYFVAKVCKFCCSLEKYFWKSGHLVVRKVQSCWFWKFMKISSISPMCHLPCLILSSLLTWHTCIILVSCIVTLLVSSPNSLASAALAFNMSTTSSPSLSLCPGIYLMSDVQLLECKSTTLLLILLITFWYLSVDQFKVKIPSTVCHWKCTQKRSTEYVCSFADPEYSDWIGR